MSSPESSDTKDSSSAPTANSTTPVPDKNEDRQARFKALQARAVGRLSEGQVP